MSPRKVRLVIDAVRGKSVKDADIRLSLMKKGAALPVLKLLRSAVANAGHNFNLAPESLYIKTITADGGPTLKRSRPRAFGRAAAIRKRTTHLSIVVASRDGMTASAPVAVPKVAKAAPVKRVRAKKQSSNA
jgi:large subunit ribosomal protein L22